MSNRKGSASGRAGRNAAGWLVDVIDKPGENRIDTETESQFVKWLESNSDHKDEFARCEAAIDMARRLRSDKEVRWAFEEAARIARGHDHPWAHARRNRWSRNPAVAWSVAAACAALAVFGFMDDAPLPPTSEAAAPASQPIGLALAFATSEPVVVLPGEIVVDAHSVAVLPFVSADTGSGTDAAADELMKALHGDIVKRLATIPGVYVVGRDSVASYADSRLHLQDIAAQLGVRGVVEGSVASDAGRIRVVMRFTDAAADKLLLQNAYERPVDQMNAIEAEMVTNIAVALAGSSRTGPTASRR